MKIFTFLFFVIFCTGVSNAQKKPSENLNNFRIEKTINSQWTFNYFSDEAADKGYESPGFNDSRWPAISLPHTWNNYETTGELPSYFMNATVNDDPYWYIGWGWYRKHFIINRDYSDRKVFIEFYGIQEYCKVWLNGKYLGDHKGGPDFFVFDITTILKSGADNVLAVAVRGNQKNESETFPVSADNYKTSAGICRDVKLVLTNRLYIPISGSSVNDDEIIISTPQASKAEGIVRVQTIVKNDNSQVKTCTLQTTISDAKDKIVQIIKSEAVINPGQSFKFDLTGKPVKNPHIWSENDQYTYKVITEVLDGKTVVDKHVSQEGLKFHINGDAANIPAVKTMTEGSKNDNVDSRVIKTPTPSFYGKTGDPAKIILNGSKMKMTADRSSVLVVTADIVDSNDNHVNGTTNTIKWNVSGPATLIGPIVYESEINKHNGQEGAWYSQMPVSNMVRSTGKPGRIHITASASGLASGTYDIDAEEIKPDNSVITEPVLGNEGRIAVARIKLTVSRLDEVPREILLTHEEFNLSPSDKKGYARVIRDYLIKNNESLDTSLIEFKTLVDLFSVHLINNKGHLSADDYNYNTDHYNNCRLIAGYIASTKLPPLFKEGLRKYYANAIIKQGSEKDAGEEMNWLNWIPSGGTVVISTDKNSTIYPKGTIITSKTELPDIIISVYPVFKTFSEDAKDRALTFIIKMNPYIHVTSNNGQYSESDKEKSNRSIYVAEKGQPVLVPLLKFISE
jgi:hypothetical protein